MRHRSGLSYTEPYGSVFSTRAGAASSRRDLERARVRIERNPLLRTGAVRSRLTTGTLCGMGAREPGWIRNRSKPQLRQLVSKQVPSPATQGGRADSV